MVMIALRFLGGVALLSVIVISLFAQAAIQEPGPYAFYHPNGDVLRAGQPSGMALAPAPPSDAYAYAGVGARDSCGKRYRSYDPGSGTFIGYDGRRHPCR
jgi:BA14K-like protein